jgi:hypothetical protein
MGVPAHEKVQPAVMGVLREGKPLTRPLLKAAVEKRLGKPLSDTTLGKAVHALLDDNQIVTSAQVLDCCGYRHDVFGTIIAEEAIVVPVQPEADGYGERPVDDAEPCVDGEPLVLALGDERIEGSGSAAFNEWRAEIGALLAPWGKVTDLGRGGKGISEESRAQIRARAGVLENHWPSYLLEDDGTEGGTTGTIYVVPVTCKPQHMKSGREWRVGMQAFKLHRTFAEMVRPARVLYAFANGEAAFIEDLLPGTNYVVTDRGSNEHIAIARGKFRSLADALALVPA